MDVLRMAGPEPVAITAAVAVSGRASGARGRTALAAWLLGLFGIVGIAAFGRLAESGEPDPVAAIVVVDGPVASVAPPPVSSSVPGPESIVLSSPARAGTTITTRELVVRGYLQDPAATVRVTLEARGNRVIDDATIVPALAFGERSTVERHAQFEVRFGLPNPRPNGRMVVQVAVLDLDGRLLDVLRRPIQVGALLQRTLGEDGLMGGLGFAVIVAPRASTPRVAE